MGSDLNFNSDSGLGSDSNSIFYSGLDFGSGSDSNSGSNLSLFSGSDSNSDSGSYSIGFGFNLQSVRSLPVLLSTPQSMIC